MEKFTKKIKKICEEHNNVGIFIDMDGTVVEFLVYPDNYLNHSDKGVFIEAEEVTPVVESLKELEDIDNLEMHILSLARTTQIKNEKKIWLKNHMSFIKEENCFILNKEVGEYTSENRDEIKCVYMEKALNKFDYVILLDDDLKILKATQKRIGKKGEVFHISSIII